MVAAWKLPPCSVISIKTGAIPESLLPPPTIMHELGVQETELNSNGEGPMEEPLANALVTSLQVPLMYWSTSGVEL